MTHLCVGVCVVVAIFLCSALVGGFGVSGLYGWIGKALLYVMFWIMFSSVLYSSSCKLYVFSLLQRNLTAAYLCWAGWLEVYGMIASVKLGFLYMDIFQFIGVLWMVTSK